MKAKISNILLNVFLYTIFILLWGAILSVLTLLRTFDTFLIRFNDGILLKAFAVIFVTGLIIPILFLKKIKYKCMLPLFLIVSTIITTAINYGILYVASDYISVYTRDKWDKYPSVRYCMLDSLNEQYEFIGMTEQKLKEILGDPAHITEYNGHTAYQYIIGDDLIDGYTYNFIFDNGILVDTSFSQS